MTIAMMGGLMNESFAENTKISLKSGAVGLIGAITLGIVMLSPAMTIYGNFGPTFLAAGKASPLVFFWALIATLPTAISYALLSRIYPSSGSAATWVAKTGMKRVARWAGWMVFFYYVTNFIIQPITLGVFLNDTLRDLGLHFNLVTYVLGVLLCGTWPAWIAYRGIRPSIHGALAFLLFEAVIVIALCLTVFIAAPLQGAHFSLEGFHTSASPSGMHGLFQALIFGMLSFCGFDVISTLGEESKMPKKLIPQATFIALSLFGFLMIAGIWVLTYAASPEQLKTIADSGGMPVGEIARMFWGRWAILVPFTAISASLGIAIATAIGASRVLHSMAERGDAPAGFSKLNPRYQVPWNAMHLIFAIGMFAAIFTALFLGPYQTMVWWGTTSTFFAMLTYLTVNSANLILFRHEILKSPIKFILHGLIPMIGLSLDGYILVNSFFIELWNQGWATGQSVIVFDLLCAILGITLALRTKTT